MLKLKLFLIIILLFSSILIASPTNFTKLNVYNNSSFTDSYLVYVVQGSTFFLQGETSTPQPSISPADYVYATCTHTSNPNDTTYIKLTQDSTDTKLYKSSLITIVQEGMSNSQLNQIGVKQNSGETIYFSFGTAKDSLIVSVPSSPTIINNLNFYSSSSYSNILTGSVPLNSVLYIEANCFDANPYTIDTLQIYVSGRYGGFNLILNESDKNTGKFRNNIQISSFNDTSLQYIKAVNVGDTIKIEVSGNTAVLNIQYSIPPTNFFEIKFKNSSYTQNKTDDFILNEPVYVQLVAEDKNANIMDTTIIVLKNERTGDTISKITNELTSGIYQTNFSLASYTNKTTGYLAAGYGDTIIVYPAPVSTKSDTLFVTIPQSPSFINNLNLYFDGSYTNLIANTVPLNIRIYIEAIGLDGNNKTVDTLTATVFSDAKYGDSIIVYLIETDVNSGKYRGYVDIDNFSYSSLNKIKALLNSDTIGIMDNISNNKKIVNIQTPTEPTAIIKIELKTDAGYSQTKTDSLVINENLYVEMIAVDLSPYTSDRARVTIKNNTTQDSIYIFLQEVSSGIFRGSFQITDFTSQTNGQIEARYGDGISLLQYNTPNVFNTYYLTVPKPPIFINNINFMNSYYSQIAGNKVLPNSILYVEVNGLDGNNKTIDTFSIKVNSISLNSVYDTIYVQLLETVNNTGKYRGQFSISNYTSDFYDVICAYQKGETVIISENINNHIDSVIIDYATIPDTIVTLNVFKLDGSAAQNVLDNEQLKIVIIAIDKNPLWRDTTQALIKNISNNNDSIYLTLIETADNSGRFEGIFSTKLFFTSQTNNAIGVKFGDTIVVSSVTDNSKIDTVTITIPLSPINIHSIVLMDKEFTYLLSNYTKPYIEIGVRLIAEDRNAYYPDTINVIVSNNAYSTAGETILLELKEISNNSGEFRNTFFLDNYTYNILRTIKSYQSGDSVLVMEPQSQKSDSIAIKTSLSPDTIISINVKTDNTYLFNYTGEYTDKDIVYIEVVASDLNPDIEDTLQIKAYSISGSETTSNDIIHITLIETEKNSNRFQGTFKITELSNDTLDELKVDYGDTIIIAYDDTNFISVKMTIPKGPITYNQLIFTDDGYTKKWPIYVQVNFGDRIYVRFTGTDGNPLTIDTVAVNLFTITTGADSLSYLYRLELNETLRNSGIYTGSVLLDVISAVTQGRMKTRQGAYIVMNTADTYPGHTDLRVVENAQDTLQTATSKAPNVFLNVSLKTKDDFTQVKYSPILWENFLYIEAEADKNSSSNLVSDTIAFLIVSRNRATGTYTDPSVDRYGVGSGNKIFYLVETAIHSGIYRNSEIEVKNINDIGVQRYSNRLEVASGDWVTITLLNPDGDANNMTFMREVAYTITPTRLKRINIFRDNSYSLASKVASYMSFEEAYRNFYFEVESFDIDGTITDTEPYSNDMLQDTVMLQLTTYHNGVQFDSMTVTLLETDRNSNIFRNWYDVPYLVNEQAIQQNQLEGNRDDTILVRSTVSDISYQAPMELLIQQFKSPTRDQIRSVRFYTDANYTQELAGTNLLMEDYVYIQVVAQPNASASILIDTTKVNLIRQDFNDTPPGDYNDSITIELTEVDVGSEIYRVKNPEPMPRIYYFRDEQSNYLTASALDTITVIPWGTPVPTDTHTMFADTVPHDATKIGYPKSPTSIFVLNIFTDAGYSVAVPDTGVVAIDAEIFLEVRGDFGNNVIFDTTSLIITNTTKNEQIVVVLKETGPRDGRYRGGFRLKSATNDTLDELGVDLADRIVIRVYGDGNGAEPASVTISIPSISYPKIIYVTQNSEPSVINNVKFKDGSFDKTILQLGGRVRKGSDLYIEVNGEDANPALSDYVYAWVFSVPSNVTPMYYIDPVNVNNYGISNARGYLKLKLSEIEKHTGKYQGVCSIRDYNDTNQKFIDAQQSDSIIVIIRDIFDTLQLKADTIMVATNQQLTYITFLNFRTSDYQGDWGIYATFDDLLYIMLFGDIGSPVIADEVEVIVYKIKARDTTASDSIILKLKETGEQTGEYRGTIRLAQSPTDVTRYDAVPPIMSIDNGDTLYLKWKDGVGWDSPTSSQLPSDSIIITGGLAQISPTQIFTVRITEDNRYIDAVDTETTRILPTDFVWVEIIGHDANPLTADTTAIIAINPGVGESIYVTLYETSKASGEYQGQFRLSTTTNQTLQLLRAGLNDTIVVYSVTAPDTMGWNTRWQVHTIINQPPLKVNSINFMSSDYNSIFQGNVLPLSTLYVELDGEDADPNWADTTIVYITSNKDTTGIKIVLQETDKNTGRFRGTFNLNSFSQEINKFINAFQFGDVVVVSDTIPQYLGTAPSDIGWWNNSGEMIFNGIQWRYRYDTIAVEVSRSPQDIIAVRIKTGLDYQFDRELAVGLDDILYIEVVAADINPLSADTTEVKLVSTKKNNPHDTSIINVIQVTLRESGPNTSKYRGSVKITGLSNDTIDELGVEFGDTITIYSTTDESVLTSIKVGILSPPSSMNQLIFTDASYMNPFDHHTQVNYGDYLYIKFTGNDGSEFTVDTVSVLVTSTGGNINDTGTGENQLFVTLTETGKHTGIYTGSIILSQTKNQVDGWLNTNLNDFIIIEPADTLYWNTGPISYNQLYGDRIQTATRQTPRLIFSIKLMNSDYNSIKRSPIKWDKYLYIECEADKLTSSNLLADTVELMFNATHDGQNNKIILWESSIHSGVFRNSEILVKNINDVGITNLLPTRLEVFPGDTVEFISTDPVGYRASFVVANYITPKRIKKINLYRDASYSNNVTDFFISFEPNYKNLYFWAEAWDLDGLLTDTLPYANDELPDTFELIIKSPKMVNPVKIQMLETEDNSNIYKNTNYVASVINVSSASELAVYAERGDTLAVYANVEGMHSGDTYPINLIVQQYKPPTIKYVKFFTNSSYSQELNQTNLNIGDKLYPQVIGENSASILKDTVIVNIKASSILGTDTFISVLLTEIDVGAEIYRPVPPEPDAMLYYRTDDNNNYLYAQKGDTVEVYPENWPDIEKVYPYRDFTYVALPQSPDRTYTINIFSDAAYSKSTLYQGIARDADLYIEVRGDIGNNIMCDTTMVGLCKANSNDTIYIELEEIGPNVGIYRGIAHFGLVSNITQKILGVNYGDTVIVTSLKNPNKAPALSSPPPISLFVVENRNPLFINSLRFKNSAYTQLLLETDKSKVLNRTKLYIELNGLDASPLLQEFTTENFVRIFTYAPDYNVFFDTMTNKLVVKHPDSSIKYPIDSDNAISLSDGHISLTLWETAKNTGSYRGDVNLSTVNDTFKVLLKADTSYTIVVWVKDSNGIVYYDTAMVANFEEPTYITDLRFMEADYENELKREVTYGENLYIEMFGDIATTLLPDEAHVIVKNLRTNDVIELTLKETGLTTGFYRGYFALSKLPSIPTNIISIPPILNVSGGDTIYLEWKNHPNTETDTVKVIVPNPVPPNNLKRLEIYKNNDFAIPYEKDALVKNSTLYIQAIEEDTHSSPVAIDTISVYVSNNMEVPETITVILIETDLSSRLYRGAAYLTESQTNETQDKIKADFGTRITLTPYLNGCDTYYKNSLVDSAVYTLISLIPPNVVNQIKFMESDWSRPLRYPPIYGDRLYIQLDGEDANPDYPDIFNVSITSYYIVDSHPVIRSDTYFLQLTETEKNSGVYRTCLDIYRVSFPSDNPPKLKAFSGDYIFVSYLNKSDIVQVKDSLTTNDVQDIIFIRPDSEEVLNDAEFDLMIIGLESVAPDINYRVKDNVELKISAIDKITAQIVETKKFNLLQEDNTSIFYKGKIKLVSSYSTDDTSIEEFKIKRGDTLCVEWIPPSDAPYWAAPRIVSKKIAEFNQPDEIYFKINKKKKKSDGTIETILLGDNYKQVDENDSLIITAIETSNSTSNIYVVDTVGITIFLYNQNINLSPKKFSSRINNGSSSLDNGRSFTLYETTKSSKTYSIELLVSNSYANANKENVLYGITPGDKLLIYLEDGINGPSFELSGGYFSPENETNYGPYPNPWNIKLHRNRQIIFAGVQKDSIIKILDARGILVAELRENNDNITNGYMWNLKNADGDNVASGVYIYIMKTLAGNLKIGKLAIIR